MSRLLRALAAGLVLAAVTAAGAAAQSGVKLRHVRKMGEKWTRTETGNATVLFRLFNQTSEGTLSTDTTTEYEVIGTGPGDAIEVRRTGKEVTRISGIPNAPEMEMQERTATTWVHEPSGKVVRSNVPEPKVDQEALMNIGSMVDYEMEQLPALESFPEKEVAAGEEWESTVPIRGADGKEKKLTVRHRLFSYDEQSGEAWIIQESYLPTDVRFGPELAGFSMTGGMRVRETVLFNNKQGRIVRGHSTLGGEYTIHLDIMGTSVDIRMAISGSGSMNQSQ